MKENFNWDNEPFSIPTNIKDAWRLVGLKNTSERKDWEKRLSDLDDNKKREFGRAYLYKKNSSLTIKYREFFI